MKKKIVLIVCTLSLLVATLPGLAAQWMHSSANADEVIYDEAIIINADGSVDPPRATNKSHPDYCIEVIENNYTLRKDIIFEDTSGFTLEKDDITLDFEGHKISLQLTAQRPVGPFTGVFAENQKGVTIKNGNITRFQYGVFLRRVDATRVFNNTVSRSAHIGIYTRYSSEVLLEGNVLLKNLEEGIYIWQSSNLKVVGNTLSNMHIIGILVHESENIEVANNIVSYNGFGSVPSYGIEIRFANANTVQRNTLANNTGLAGIAITDKSYGNVIEQNTVTHHNGTCAIYIEDSNETEVQYNNAASNVGNGIELQQSCQNKIHSNTASNNTVGINLKDNSNDNTVFANTLTLNRRAGVALHQSKNNKVDGNTVSNNLDGILLQGCDGTDIRENHIFNSNGTGIGLQEHSGDTERNEILGNFIFNSSFGISILTSDNNKVERNDIIHSLATGFELHGSSSNEVIGNYIQNSGESGILLLNSDNNKIRCNTVVNIGVNASVNINITNSNNHIGINVTNSRDNKIYYNNFIENTQQVCGNTLAENTWNDGKLYPCPICMVKTGEERAAGNYWSDYAGSDAGSQTQGHNCSSDGIGDSNTPHQGIDYYPLMAPYVPMKGDINLDGIVDIFDIVELTLNFGHSWSE